MAPEITVFVSCYNERASVVPTIETLLRAFARTTRTFEILVIDDCSTDGSPEAVEAFVQSRREIALRLIRHEVNRGLAYTIFEAARLARGRYFWCVAGDNPVPEETCVILLDRLGSADIIIPHVVKYVGRTLFRRALSDVYGFVVRLASGSKVRYFNGSSIYLREQFLAHDDIPAGFGYSAEMITALEHDGCSHVEVPVRYNERSSGTSSALTLRNLSEVVAMFRRLLARRLGIGAATAGEKLLSDRR